MAYLPGYTKAAPLVVNHALVGAGGVSDFRMLAPMTLPANLAAAMAYEDCRDLRFTLADGTTPLYHELVSGSASAKTLQAWVQVPSILSSSDTTILAQVGNAAATMPSAADQQATWDGGGVVNGWHLEQASGNAPDFTGNNNAAVPSAQVTANIDGKIGKGISVSNGSADGNMTIGTAQLSLTAGAASLWYRPNAGMTAITHTFFRHFATNSRIYLADNNSAGTHRLYAAYATNGLGATTGSFAEGVWSRVLITWDGPTYAVYLNGVSVGGATVANLTNKAAAATYATDYSSCDEVVISSAARSAAYAATEYANQSAPDTFSTWGPLETLSSYVPRRRNILYRSGPTLRGVIH